MNPFERICRLLEERSGHVFFEGGRQRLADTVQRRIRELGCQSLEEYARLVEGSSGEEEWQRLVSEMTINESYLFRGPAQWKAMAEEALPALIESVVEEEGELVAWSAACARGEEAATLAMVLAEAARSRPFRWRIVATDVDQTALEVSRGGHFRQRAVRNVPARLVNRYLRPDAGGFRLVDELQERIEYGWLNLADTPWPFATGAFQIVLLRNVLIYFGEASRERAIREARRVLAHGGWLFVGPTESLWGTDEGLQAINLGDCFAYRHRENPSLLRHTPRTGRGVVWRRDTAPAGGSMELPVATPPAESPSMAGIVRLLRQGDAGAALVMANRLLESGGGRAEVQTLAGICHQRLGELGSAIERYRAALYLEPGLFQVHWLLARCLEEEGWPEAARREYRTVLEQSRNPTVIPLAFGEVLGLPDAGEAGRGAAAALENPANDSDRRRR